MKGYLVSQRLEHNSLWSTLLYQSQMRFQISLYNSASEMSALKVARNYGILWVIFRNIHSGWVSQMAYHQRLKLRRAIATFDVQSRGPMGRKLYAANLKSLSLRPSKSKSGQNRWTISVRRSVFIHAETDGDTSYRNISYTQNSQVSSEKGLHPKLFFVLNEPEENLCNTPWF